MKLGCVLLAAGLGRRFGGDKLLRPVDGRTLFHRAVDALPADCFVKIAAVSGRREILDIAAARKLVPIWNPAPEDGISRSVKCGLAAMTDMDGVLFSVCDQPLLTEQSIRNVVTAFIENPAYIVALGWNGARGNPVLFPRDLFPALMALDGDRGGGAVIVQYPDRLRMAAAARREELLDVDEAKDLAALGLAMDENGEMKE